MQLHGDRKGLSTTPRSGFSRPQLSEDGLTEPYRSFGSLDFAPPDQVYTGHPDDGGKDIGSKTEKMFAKLMKRMSQPFKFPDGTVSTARGNFNPQMPAGYTYFAQLVAHDITQNSASPGNLSRPQLTGTNGRRRSLMLDTVYGAGPRAEMPSYELPRDGETSRTRLRTSQVDGSQIDATHPEPTGCPYLDRDLPRALQTDFSDRPKHGRPDVLVPDHRNDDTAMMSQITVLFHQFHNAVLDRVTARGLTYGDPDAPAPVDASNFAMARALVTRGYRNIVRHDLLPRLLNADVYAAYKATGFHPLVEKGDDFADANVPMEFSHAAFRIGHAMVRSAYTFNDSHDPQGLSSALLRSSSAEPRFFPLRTNWVAQWSKFFDLGSRFFELDIGAPQNARRIGPSYNDVLLLETQFANSFKTTEPDAKRAGLLFRDLARGKQAGLLKLDVLIDLIIRKTRDKPLPFMSPDIIQNISTRAKTIREWLKAASPVDIAFDDSELHSLSNDPPLLFWILFEAAAQESGKCLGTIGSILVGEAITSGLHDTIDLLQSDAGDPEKLERHIFGGAMPKTMPDLVEYVTKVLKLNYVTPRFV